MVQKLVGLSIPPLAFLALVGCTNRELYDGTMTWRTKECEKLQEPERTECMDRARMPDSQYEKARAKSTQEQERE